VHDGSGSARACPVSWNNIMTPLVGAYTNANSMFYFSNCSVNSITSTILSGTWVFSIGAIKLYFKILILIVQENV
jgi:hypothetical protein